MHLASKAETEIYNTAEEEFEDLCFEYGIELDDVVSPGQPPLQIVQLEEIP